MAAVRSTPKQSLEKSALIRGCIVRYSALFVLLFCVDTGANKLMDLITGLKVALGELLINVVAWIGVPNEPRDFYEKLTACSELGIAPFQQREGGATNARVV